MGNKLYFSVGGTYEEVVTLFGSNRSPPGPSKINYSSICSDSDCCGDGLFVCSGFSVSCGGTGGVWVSFSMFSRLSKVVSFVGCLGGVFEVPSPWFGGGSVCSGCDSE